MSIELESKVGKRGQVVIPKALRDALNIRPGMKLSFRAEGDKLIVSSGGDVLEDYLSEIPKRPEPEDMDWDEEYYSQFED